MMDACLQTASSLAVDSISSSLAVDSISSSLAVDDIAFKFKLIASILLLRLKSSAKVFRVLVSRILVSRLSHGIRIFWDDDTDRLVWDTSLNHVVCYEVRYNSEVQCAYDWISSATTQYSTDQRVRKPKHLPWTAHHGIFGWRAYSTLNIHCMFIE